MRPTICSKPRAFKDLGTWDSWRMKPLQCQDSNIAVRESVATCTPPTHVPISWPAGYLPFLGVLRKIEAIR